MSEKMLLIDGHSMLNRAFYGLPDLTNSEGKHTGAVYGFLNILFRVLEEEKPAYLAVAFDVHQPTFRHEMYAEYKGTRKAMPDELREQVPLMKEVLRAMKITIMELPGFEADDVLGTMARKGEEAGREVSVLSGDRDLLQLATDRVLIRIPKTKKGTTVMENYHAAEVKELYGVTPTQFIDMKALMGDTSDNIPGVPGIGEKGAGALIAEYGSIENAHEHAAEIKGKKAREGLMEHYDLAQLSKTLATIDRFAPVEEAWMDCLLPDYKTPEAYELMKRLEFKAIAASFRPSEEKKEAGRSFYAVASREEAEAFLAAAEKAKSLGVCISGEEEAVSCVSLAFEIGPEDLSSLAEYGIEKDGFVIPVFPLEHKKEEPVQMSLFGASWEEENSAASGRKKKAKKEEAVSSAFGLPEEWLKERLTKLLAASAQVNAMDLKAILRFLPDLTGEMQKETADASRFFDAGIAAYLLNPLKNTYPYDDVAKDFLNQTVPSYLDLAGKKNWHELQAEGGENFDQAAGYPAYVALAARDSLLSRLQKEGMDRLYREIELPLIPVLVKMEAAGVRVEKDALKEYGEKLQERIDAVQKEIYAETEEEFNINSPKQLGEILFEKMKLPGGKKTKSGYSTAADVLEKLAPSVPVVSKILEYRQYTKLKSTYADGLGAYIRKDGRIHGRFHQTVTATGRLSSTDPNLQNIPVRMELGREIRRLFVPEDGCVLVDADYSQIELRVLASMSGDEQLIEAYNQAQDIHAITASKVFGVPLSEVTPLMRRNAKAVNFGIVYGISAFGLSEDLSISRKQAMEYIDQYFATYPKIKIFLDKMVSDAKKKGYTETLYGRRRPMPELKSSNFMQRSFGERVAMNAPIQGTAADIIKIAMIRVEERLRREECKTRLILQVHDELVLEAPEEEKEKVSRILAEEMQNAAKLAVKLEVDLHTGKSWYEAK